MSNAVRSFASCAAATDLKCITHVSHFLTYYGDFKLPCFCITETCLDLLSHLACLDTWTV